MEQEKVPPVLPVPSLYAEWLCRLPKKVLGSCPTAGIPNNKSRARIGRT
jgi:hypothetical protein